MSQIQDLLERYRRGVELVAVAATGAAGPELDWTPAPEKWSVRQILCHLADSEIVDADRFRRVLAEDNPTIIGYDQEAWARNLDYTRRKVSQALETFRHLRGENYELLKGAPEEAFSRTGTHNECGRQTLLEMLALYVRHAEGHAEQIRDLRRRFKEQRGAPSAAGR